MSYTYSPRLKAPDKSIDVNMEKPAVVRMMKALCRGKQREITPEWMARRGVTYQVASYPGRDGAPLSVFVISPACAVGEKTGPAGGDAPGKRPGMVYLHGGAYALPVQQSALELAAVYARELGVTVFVPEYRLLPEYRGQSILEDCIGLWEWLFDRGEAEAFALDLDRMLLYGESAGGALAAGLALYLQDAGKRLPAGMFLIYPVLDRDTDYASKREFAEAAWSCRSNESMWNAYLEGAGEEWMKYLVPMEHPNLAGLPPTYLEPQEIDILRDEAQAFGERLSCAGVPCRVNLIGGSYHSFDMDLTSSLVQEVVAERVREMKQTLLGEKQMQNNQ